MLHISLLQVIVLSILQGITELFPISSLGHTVILPALLHWGDLVRSQNFLPFIVALHVGTSIALFVYFWKDWYAVIKAVLSTVIKGEIIKGTEEWTGWLIIIGTIPAAVIGVFLETPIKKLFATPFIAAAFLAINGSILLLGEQFRKKQSQKEQTVRLQNLTWKDALFIGIAQSLALIPGISRSGSSMVAGLMKNLNHEDAARFAFLLGTPVIAGAAVAEIPSLFTQKGSTVEVIFFGMALSGIAAFMSTKFLMKYFETKTLLPFAYYCLITGVLSFIAVAIFRL